MRRELALVAVACGACTGLLLLPVGPWHACVLQTATMLLTVAWLGGCLVRWDRALVEHRAWRQTPDWRCAPSQLVRLHPTTGQAGILLGKGFPWTAAHTQILESALAQDKALPVATGSRGGHPALHAIGRRREQTVLLPWAELVGHLRLLGTTRSGKSRCLEVLASEAIRGRGAVAIIDPKGDRELLARCAAEAQRQGRPFHLFTPAFVSQSASFDPLANATTPEEVSARIRVLLPSAGGRAPVPFFDEYALAVIETIAAVQGALGQRWTLKGLYAVSNFRSALEQLLADYLLSLGCHVQGKLSALVGEYRKRGDTDLLAEALIEYVEKPRADFGKVTSSLIPAFRGVVSGTLGSLLAPSPDALTWPGIVEDEAVVYFALSSMLIGDIANRMGRIVLQDLVGYLGKVYAYTTPESMRPLTVMIDECGDVLYPGFTNALNKGGGAEARFVLAHQSLADTEGAVGREQSQRIEDNLNTTLYFRLRSDRTAQAVSEGSGRCTVQVPETAVGQAYGGVGGLSGSARRSLRARDVPLIRPEWLKGLPRGEAFVQMKGELWKIRVPLLEPISPEELETLGLAALWEGLAPDGGRRDRWFDDEEGEDAC